MSLMIKVVVIVRNRKPKRNEQMWDDQRIRCVINEETCNCPDEFYFAHLVHGSPGRVRSVLTRLKI